MRKTKSILTWVLVVCMVISIFPVPAYALTAFNVEGGEINTDYTDDGSVITVLTSKAITIKGDTTEKRIVIGNGSDAITANITLNSVNIESAGASPIKVMSDCTLNLTLTGSNVLTSKSGSSGVTKKYPAINVPDKATLNVNGNGSLEAAAMFGSEGTFEACAAIGSDTDQYRTDLENPLYPGQASGSSTLYFEKAGTIVINSGSITTKAKTGIGGTMADITINGGTVNVMLSSSRSDICIGGESADIKILGGTVNVTGEGQTGNFAYPETAIGGDNSTVKIANADVKAYGHGVGIGGDICNHIGDQGYDYFYRCMVDAEPRETTACEKLKGASVIIDSGKVETRSYDSYGTAMGGWGCNVTVNDGTVKAFGVCTGIGLKRSSSGADEFDRFDITINGGNVTAWGGCDFGAAENKWTAGYDFAGPSDSNYNGLFGIGGKFSQKPESHNIIITGGIIDAKGGEGAIGGDFEQKGSDDIWDSTERLNIKISGGTIDAAAYYLNDVSAIGGKMYSYDSRTIEITGGIINAEARGGSAIGGGDCGDGSTDRSIIRIAGDTQIQNAIGGRAAAAIGAGGYDNSSGKAIAYSGGKIIIEGDASIGDIDPYHSSFEGAVTESGTGHFQVQGAGIGGAGGSVKQGGAGGVIIIDTTGVVEATSIGGGNADDTSESIGGSGGTITVKNGIILENSNYSRSDGYDNKGYSGAFIGGGGGYTKGGDGGVITISGGEIGANSRFISLSFARQNETDAICGAAAIGGGNGASGGTIDISGGKIRLNTSYKLSDNSPAFIGGGSDGGSGNITVSGGNIYGYIYYGQTYSYNFLGHSMSYKGTGGSVKITGGSMRTSQDGDESRIRPVPKNTEGVEVFPIFTNYVDDGYYNDYSQNGEFISFTVDGYSYGSKNMMYENLCLWLPESADGKDIIAQAKAGNTIYNFTGNVEIRENTASGGQKYTSGITNLKCIGTSTSTLSLTLTKPENFEYNGLNRLNDITYVVKDNSNKTLAKGTDYDLSYEIIKNVNGTDVYTKTSEMKNAGRYRVTASGKGQYADMSDQKEIGMNPKHIEVTYSGEKITKQYDGNVNVYDTNGAEVTSIAVSVNPSDLCGTDKMTNPRFETPVYQATGVGTEIDIRGNFKFDEMSLDVYNYRTDQPVNLKGDITVKVIGESNISQGTLKIEKVYDGNATVSLSNVTGELKLVDLVGEEVAAVSIGSFGNYPDKNVGTDKNVTVTLGNLSGANAENYTLAGGAASFTAKASILPAQYTYTVLEEQEIKKGSGLSAIVTPEKAVGISNEEVLGTVLWFKDAQRSQPATDNDIKNLAVGTKITLYLKFTPSAGQSNYVAEPKNGLVNITVVTGDPQDITFAEASVTKTYGDNKFTNPATNRSENGGVITYTSDNAEVATVNKTTGEITIIGAGKAVITATAAQLEGVWAETKVTYNLTVDKKPVTVNADDKTKIYGTENPSFTFTHTASDLVETDTVTDLGVLLSCTANINTSVGTVKITGTSDSKNYDVTVAEGTLTITKAQAPTIPNVSKSVVYNVANNNVTANIIGFPTDCGTKTFAIANATTEGGISSTPSAIVSGMPTIDGNGTITFSTIAGDAGASQSFDITVEMQNYETASLKFTVTLVDKKPVKITGIEVSDKIYDSLPISVGGSIDSGEYDKELVYSYISTDGGNYSSEDAPKDAGSYRLTVSVPESAPDFIGSSEPILFTIQKASLSVKPSSHSIYTNDTMPVPTVVYDGLKGNDASMDVCVLISGGLNIAIVKSDGTLLENTNINGEYTIKFEENPIFEAAKNYNISIASGKLSISTRPSTGGGSTGGVSESTNDFTVDGSTTTVVIEIKATTSNNVSTAVVDSKDLTKAIDEVLKESAKNGTNANVEIKVDAPSNANEIKIVLPADALNTLAEGGNSSIKISTSNGNIVLDNDALKGILSQISGKELVISIKNVDNENLSAENLKKVGDRPVIDLSITADGKNISDFDGGTARVALPYNLRTNESKNGLVIWYLNGGEVTEINCNYDEKSNEISFETGHFSYYVIGYDAIRAWNNPFTDISQNAWYYRSVSFANIRGLMNGITAQKFAPSDNTTRAMLITILYRLENEPDVLVQSFDDVANTWYTNAVYWAVENNIATGYGNSLLGPNDKITREQMAVMLYNYARYKGFDTNNTAGLSSFSDLPQVSSWANNAVEWAVAEGIINGRTATELAPQGLAQRAEIATILQRFIEKFVD